MTQCFTSSTTSSSQQCLSSGLPSSTRSSNERNFSPTRSIIRSGLKVSILFLRNYFVDEDFNRWVFWRWMFYATWQSCIVLFLCFYSMDMTSDDDGMLGSLYVDGQYVYLAVVTLVNIKILTSTNNHNVFSFVLVFASVFTYVVFYWAVTLVPSTDVYGEFKDLFLHENFGFALFFMGVSLVMVDIGLHHAQRGLQTIVEIREFEREEKKKKDLEKDRIQFKRRITNYHRKFFWFMDGFRSRVCILRRSRQ